MQALLPDVRLVLQAGRQSLISIRQRNKADEPMLFDSGV